MKKLTAMIIALVFLFNVIPVAAAPTQNIVEIASGDPNFSVLVEAVVAAGLDDELSGPGPLTVFAPTNAAFTALLADLGVSKAELLAHPDLADVLLYHVLSGKVMSTDLIDDQQVTTLQGEKVVIDLTPTTPTVNDAEITAVDIEATNGVIHVIDKVLVPASFGAPENNIVDIALSNPDFSILVAALQKANLVGALQGTGPFTVFAPTNAAFTALLTQLGITAEELLAQPDLGKVLLHHVVAGKVMSTDLTNGMEAMTLNNDKLTFTLDTDPPSASVNGAAITAVDIEASNGVIHVISSVMVPSNFTLQEVDDEEDIPETGDNQLYIIAGFLVAGTALLLTSRRRRQNVQQD